MDYRKIYQALIDRSKHRVIDGYTEKHHIVPRCLGGSDDPENIAILTAQEHFVCHLLLSKMYPGSSKLMAAAMFMCGGPQQRHTNKVYGWLREQWSRHMTENNPNVGGKANRKYKENYLRVHGTPPPPPSHGPNWSISPAGKKILATKMQGEKNPCAGIKPWKHPRATDYTRSVWSNADTLYDLWQSNDDPSYFALYNLANGKSANGQQTVIAPYMNIVKYFRKGWVPSHDSEWTDWKNSK